MNLDGSISPPADVEVELIRQVRRELPGLGGQKMYKCIYQPLRTNNLKVGRDKMFTIMRKYHLLIDRKKRSPKTTQSHHWFRRYPNLIKKMTTLFSMMKSNLTITRGAQSSIQPLTYKSFKFNRAMIGPVNLTLFMLRPFISICLLFTTPVSAQLEISSGIAVNKNEAKGFPVHVGYEFQIANKFYTKPQVGYKYLHHFNDYVGATLKVSTWEIHQTFSFEIVKSKKYILKPNLGVNYRFYHWQGEMQPPFNTLPERAWVIGTREGRFVVTSYDGGQKKEYKVNTFGFSIQLQNQFRLIDKVWLQVTPFMEPDYDRSQNTGGAYIGVVFKSL